MLPEPYFLKDRASISIHDIDQRIQLKKRLHVIAGQHVDIPHDRRRPHTDLERNADHLLQIPDKDHQSTRQITQPQDKEQEANAVVNDLYGVYRGRIAVAHRHNQQYSHKEHMNEGSRNDFDDGQNTDVKHDLFDQIAVFY